MEFEEAQKLEEKYFNKLTKEDLFYMLMGELRFNNVNIVESHLKEIISDKKKSYDELKKENEELKKRDQHLKRLQK